MRNVATSFSAWQNTGIIVATTRPEFRPPWGMRWHHATIALAPLDRAQVRDMIAELSARHALPREAVDNVAARTGGVPLFVEEVTRLLLERGEKGGINVTPPCLFQGDFIEAQSNLVEVLS
jgi:predicted ATPase